MSSPYYLAIDGGGTNTRARLADISGRIIGEGLSGSSNLTLGIETAGTAIAAAGDAALKAAGLGEGARASVHAGLGLAGANVPALAEAIGSFAFGYRTVAVASDAVSACLGAHGGGDGGILVLGTGSQGLALVGGKSTAIGGWGFAISDEGSGHWIGRSAVAAAMAAWDEHPDQNAPLIDILMKSWHVQTIEQLVPVANATPPPDFAALFPAVLSLAESGDAAARDVLTRAGHHLARLAGIVITRLFPNGGAVPVAMSGGVFGSSGLVRQVFYNSLHSGHPDAVLNPNVIEPVRGALALARQSMAK